MTTIKQAKINDLKDIYEIFESCTKWLYDKNIKHWKGVYSIDFIKQRIEKDQVYLLKDDEISVGTISLIEAIPKYFKCWKDLSANGIHIAGLAVLPKQMNKGHATQLIEYAENIAKRKKIKYIRIDASSADNNLTNFYQNRGYEIAGNQQVTEIYKANFFEKNIK